jgi:hypothetical protein
MLCELEGVQNAGTQKRSDRRVSQGFNPKSLFIFGEFPLRSK